MKPLALLFAAFVAPFAILFAQDPANAKVKDTPVPCPAQEIVCIDAAFLKRIEQLLKNHELSQQEFEFKRDSIAKEIDIVVARIQSQVDSLPEDGLLVIDSREEKRKAKQEKKLDK